LSLFLCSVISRISKFKIFSFWKERWNFKLLDQGYIVQVLKLQLLPAQC
jgi:hypothetical protein